MYHLKLKIIFNFILFLAHQHWSQWTDCSATCGGGSQTRHRECVSNGEEIHCFGTTTDNDIVQAVVPMGFLSYEAWQESTAESRTCRQIACRE